MKIKKTTGRDVQTYSVNAKEAATNKEQPKEKNAAQIGDTVSLSADAVAAGRAMVAKGQEIEEVSKMSSRDAPLPDPRETSQAILEKELAQVFREIYL
ncbi:MAG: hypothetical protein QNJ97_01285 [Myxococcota bacterium]|nr:hypothetical protein [Myxococcota bacterium]